MEKETFIQKVKRRSWFELRKRLKGRSLLLTYKSYWHYLLHKSSPDADLSRCYYAARPNIGAGIGHQMANWMAGYYYAKMFGLSFAHIPFAQDAWENFLGFGLGESQYYDLVNKGYSVVRLPKFDLENQTSVDLNKKIIQSYSGTKTVFIATQDQFLKNLQWVSKDIKRKFKSAPARSNDHLQYTQDKYNIAIHVRRVVVIDGKTINESEEVRQMRWLSNDYYEKVLGLVLKNINPGKPIAIWIFSTGKPEEFSEFSKYGEVHFCSDMDEYTSFAHLVFADLLITSKSSFSYKPALMNDGIKVCPRNFWHGYPDAKDWILCENDGTFDTEKLKALFR